VALVIGNAGYQSVSKLPNPSKDANAMAELFREAGFDVVDARYDLNNLEFKRAIRRFSTAVIDADIAVVYYAGHGIEVGGKNYLIPVDAKLAVDLDADDEALQLDRILQVIERAKKLQLVILDACRDNPFGSNMRRTVATRSISNGLGEIAPANSNVLIAYAAKAGSLAEDGYGQNSPFTTALLRNITQPNLDIRLAFGRVRDEVLRNTNNRQEPYVYGSLGGGSISLVATNAPAKVQPEAEIKADYELVERIGSAKAWEVFLKTHPDGLYADLARMQLARLNAGEPNVPPGSARVPPAGEAAKPPAAEPAKPAATDTKPAPGVAPKPAPVRPARQDAPSRPATATARPAGAPPSRPVAMTGVGF
jgi:hypothetical protein